MFDEYAVYKEEKMFWKLVDMIADLFSYAYSSDMTRRKRERVLGGLFSIPLLFLALLFCLFTGNSFAAVMFALFLGPFVICSIPEIFDFQYPKPVKWCLWGVYAVLFVIFFGWIAAAMR